MIMNFDITMTASFDIDDLAERVINFVEFNMWERLDEEEDDYNNLSGEDHNTLIIEILKTALKKYEENT